MARTPPKTPGQAALEAEALAREQERKDAADAEAIKTMSPEQIEAARFCRMTPSEWLYWSSKKSRWSVG